MADINWYRLVCCDNIYYIYCVIILCVCDIYYYRALVVLDGISCVHIVLLQYILINILIIKINSSILIYIYVN